MYYEDYFGAYLASGYKSGYGRFPMNLISGKFLKTHCFPFFTNVLIFRQACYCLNLLETITLAKNIHRQYKSPFSKPSERNGTLAFSQSLLNDQPWFASLWQQIDKLADKPLLFLWGMKDKFVSPQYLHKFQSPFKNKKIIMFKNCGHFPQEEASQEVIKAIESFI